MSEGEYKKGLMQKIFSQKIRFKADDGSAFPDWEEKELGDATTINPKVGELPDKFVYIDLESVTKGVLVKSNQISRVGAPSRAQRLLNKKDVIFQTVRPYQKNNYFFDLEGSYVASTGYAQLRVSGSPGFFYQALHRAKFVSDVMARSTGTSYPSINSTDLSKIKVNLPTKPEQQKIAVFLTTIDTKIEQLSKKEELLGEYKKGLMQKIFSQEIRFKADDGSAFPDWEEKELGDATTINPKVGELPDKFVYIDLESVTKGVLVKSNQISRVGAPSRAQRLLNKKDVIFQTVRPYQKNNYFFDLEGSYVASTGYAQLRVSGCPEFFYQALHRAKFVSDVMARSTGTSYPSINSTDLSKIKVNLPTKPEQQKIAELLTSVDTKIEQVIKQLDETKQFKKALLQQMFV